MDVDVQVGRFRGDFQASLRVDEFEPFLAEVRALQDDLGRSARFETMEDWLSLSLKGDGLGHISVEGMTRDEAGQGNTLTFRFKIDQTFLPELVRELAAELETYPVQGRRP